VTPATVAEEVRALERLDLEGLRAEWTRRWGSPPSLRSVDLLRRNLAWRIQAEIFGGLDSETREAIFRKGRPAAGPLLRLGTRVAREWRGIRHEVEVADSGYLYRGRSFDSLSGVAREITGARWNGPRFFGLRPGRAGS
jgi:hypothetical protein